MTNRIELDITERVAFAGGHAFGDVGEYERLSGRARFAVDPRAAAQDGVVDLDKAQVDADGLVRFAADFMILKPREMERGNRRVFYDYGNRGHKRALQFFNDAQHSNTPITLAHAGNGFFMRRGYAVAWVAWEGDMLPGDGRMVLDVPVATEAGKPITGRIRVEYIADVAGITCFPLSGRIAAHSYATVSLDTRDAVLTRRRYPYDQPEVIPHDQWRFACAEFGVGGETQSVERAVVPSARHIYLPAGFQPGWIYELVYTAKDPLVHGLGHVAVRDFISFLKYDQIRGQSAAGGGEGVCLGALADRAVPARFRVPRVQCRRAGPARIRWRVAACRRSGAEVAEPSVCQSDRIGWSAIRGPLQYRRQLSVFLCVVHRPSDGQAGCDPEAT